MNILQNISCSFLQEKKSFIRKWVKYDSFHLVVIHPFKGHKTVVPFNFFIQPYMKYLIWLNRLSFFLFFFTQCSYEACWLLWNEEDSGLKQKEMQMQKETHWLVIRGRGKQLASQPSLLTEWLTTCKTVITDKQQSTREIPSCHLMQGEIGWEDHQVSSFRFFFPPSYFIGYSWAERQ